MVFQRLQALRRGNSKSKLTNDDEHNQHDKEKNDHGSTGNRSNDVSNNQQQERVSSGTTELVSSRNSISEGESKNRRHEQSSFRIQNGAELDVDGEETSEDEDEQIQLEEYPKIMQKLVTFEKERRTQFRARLEQSAAKHFACQKLLQAALVETSKAFRLVHGVSQAQLDMSRALGNHQDLSFTEDNHNAISSVQESLVSTNHTLQRGLQQKRIESSSLQEWENVIHDKHKEMNEQGVHILKEFQQLEKDIDRCWAAYSTAAKGLVQPLTRKSGEGDSGKQDADPTSLQERDTWLAEALYRRKVQEQYDSWQAKCVTLDNLVQSVQELECLRRMQMKALLVRFVHEHAAVLQAFNVSAAVALTEDWIHREETVEELEREVDAAIHQRLQSIRIDFSEENQESNLKLYEEMFGPESFLNSDFLLYVSLVTAKGSASSGSKKVELAVLTTDRHLYFFSLPDNVNITLNDDPMTVFRILLTNAEELGNRHVFVIENATLIEKTHGDGIKLIHRNGRDTLVMHVGNRHRRSEFLTALERVKTM